MAFSVPNFNLSCDVYAGPWTTRVLRLNVMGNLQFARRGHVLGVFSQPTAEPTNGPTYLLLPALTDIRSFVQGIADPDYVEVPSGSGRWYGVAAVDDVGKGFPNEFRIAEIYQVAEPMAPSLYPGLFWPIPMP